MPRLSEDTIQRAAEANDIVEVIGSYFPLKRAGTSFRAVCPFHKEKTPSFHVNPQRQTYHCFGCGAGGNVFRFIMEYEHLDFVSAVRRMAQRAGIPIIEEAGTAEDDRKHDLRRRLLALHADAAAWFQHHLLKDPAAQVARDYLKSRGLTAETAKTWQLGYAPDSWDALLDFLREKKFTTEEIAESGLAASKQDEDGQPQQPVRFYARFRGRVMFPICNDYGEVIAFSGRVLDAEAKTAKYVNSPETPLFTKGRVLYGLHKSKRALIDASTAIVCEGQVDLISAFESGVENVIAPQGTAFTPEQARLLRRFVDTVILCFDSDRAGQEAVTRSLPALLDCGMEVRVARLPAGEDPDSLIRGKGPEAFRAVVDQARNFFDHAIDLLVEIGALDDPVRKSKAVQRLGPYVASIKDPVLREETLHRICPRLGITESAFVTHMKAVNPAPGADEPVVKTTEPLPLSKEMRVLSRLALMYPEVRSWLAEQTSPPLKEMGEGGELLEKIVGSPLALEETSARAVFLSQLNSREEVTINSLDTDRSQEHALPIAQNWWMGMAAAVLHTQREMAKAKLRQPELSATERNHLQMGVTEMSKQILDLQSRLNEV